MIFCNAFRTDRPQRIFFSGVLCFVIALLTNLFYHPASDWSRGFVLGFTGVLFAAEIIFLLICMIMQRQAVSAPRSRG